MTDRDPSIIGVCSPRDVHWLNAALNARTPEDVDRAVELHAIARALRNLPTDSEMPAAMREASLTAFAGVNLETLGQVLSPTTAPASNPDPSPRTRTRDSL